MDRENKSADDVRQESKRLYPLLSEKEKRMVLTEAYRYLQQEAERRWKLAEGKAACSGADRGRVKPRGGAGGERGATRERASSH